MKSATNPYLLVIAKTKAQKLNEKRYQVFISSTFDDLKAERRAVQDVVINTGDFPVQMESFPAADEDQFVFIKSLIDNCDYYVLIIAGRYGSLAEDGLSYTEKEYQYAVSVGVPVLVMLHGDSGKIPAEKTEDTEAGKKRLAAFIDTVQTSRIRKNWTTLDGLKLVVREALDHAKATKQRIGWVRGDTIARVETLEELNEVRKENEKFKKALGELEIELALPSLPAPDDTFIIDLLPNTRGGRLQNHNGSEASVRTTWISAFPVFHSNLKCHTSEYNDEYSYYIEEEESCVSIGSAIAGEVEPIDTTECFKISNSALNRLMNYYIESGLMNPVGMGNAFTETAQKYARRYSISSGKIDSFELTKGKIAVSTSTIRSGFNDDIPF